MEELVNEIRKVKNTKIRVVLYFVLFIFIVPSGLYQAYLHVSAKKHEFHSNISYSIKDYVQDSLHLIIIVDFPSPEDLVEQMLYSPFEKGCEKLFVKINDKTIPAKGTLSSVKLNEYLLHLLPEDFSKIINRKDNLSFSFIDKKQFFSEKETLAFVLKQKDDNVQFNSNIADNALVKIKQGSRLLNVMSGIEFKEDYNLSDFEIRCCPAENGVYKELNLQVKK